MLEDMKAPVSRQECKIKTTLAELEPKDKLILLDAVMNPQWAILNLSNELKRRGIRLGEKAITAHRKGLCPCSKI